MELIRQILELVLGYRYRAVVLKYCGVQKFALCEYIFSDTETGKRLMAAYLERLETNSSFKEYEIVSFRSLEWYGDRVKDWNESQREIRERVKMRRYGCNKDV